MSKLVNLRFVAIIWKEFRFLSVVGASYGFFHSKVWAAVTILNYTMMYSVLLVTMSLLSYTTYLLRDNISYVSQALHCLIVGMVASTASVSLSLKRYKMEKFAVFFEDPWSLCEYSKNDYFELLMKEATRKKNRLIVTWILIYGACGVVCLSQPIIDKLFGTPANMANLNGAWMNLPIILWWPEDTTMSNEAWLEAYILEGLYLCFSAIIVIAGCVLCFSTAERLLDQFKLLIYGIKKLDERAEDMFYQKFPGLDIKYMEKEYDDCYYECLVQNIKHHIKMIMWIEKFIDMTSLPIAVPFFGGAILLGMALITITEEDDPRMGPKCLAATLAFSEAYNMFLLCDVGQRLQNLSQELYDALYFCSWNRRSQRVKRAVQIMRIGCKKPLKLTAVKLLVLNMELFADINNFFELNNVWFKVPDPSCFKVQDDLPLWKNLANSAYSIFSLKAANETRRST